MIKVSNVPGSLAIVGTITGYLSFNVIVGNSSIMVLGFVNLAGALGTAGLANKNLFWKTDQGHLRLKFPEWTVGITGSIGVVLIAIGLKFSQMQLGTFATMQLVYDGFVITGSVLSLIEEKTQGKMRSPSFRFNIALHLFMALIVAMHIYTNWEWDVDVFMHALLFVLTGILGYHLFNRALSSASDQTKMTTNISMNILAGISLCALSPFFDSSTFASTDLLKIAGGGVALLLIVGGLGTAYRRFKQFDLAYLVPVLVYDGLLIAPALLQMLDNPHGHILINMMLSLAMVGIMCLRAPSLQIKILRQISTLTQAGKR